MRTPIVYLPPTADRNIPPSGMTRFPSYSCQYAQQPVLGALAKLRKASLTFKSVSPHQTIRLPLDGFS